MAEDMKHGGPEKRDLVAGRLEEGASGKGNPTKIETTAARSSGGYEVGYGRPPKQSQFKPGQSGNPRGRPRKPNNDNKNSLDVLVQGLGETIMVRKGGVEVAMTMREAILQRMLLDCVSGRPRSAKPILELLAAADAHRQKQTPTDFVDHAAEVRAKLAEMHERIKAREREDEERAKRGLPPLR